MASEVMNSKRQNIQVFWGKGEGKAESKPGGLLRPNYKNLWIDTI
jgi:hypothetical protein